ncbi:GGDEF domain-containing protein [Rhizobium sp. S96]|uniref:GGDEF domain-containing protein n=1 Tax=Rhizobium sp. S96 TaxID=3055140 RepID=UPI0025AADEDC|nr:GGDEF domain-containing protein [Rhizobium sp. S96]MDM9619235.1 GGDEF domain-containing protein [Rhizobium sp. S96]
MTLDYNSLLIALAVSAACLAVTLLGSWFARRTETFLLTCTIGLVLIVSGIFAYGLYVGTPTKLLGITAFVFFFPGFAAAVGAGYQFRTGRLPCRMMVAAALAGYAVTIPPMAIGYDGFAFIAENTVIASLLFVTAYQYWLARAEAPVPLTGITALYILTAISFVLCASVLLADGKVVLGAAPSNWAEDLSLAICIASMTGIGALSLALHQWRLAARHRIEATTDSLTGLLNRRALFDQYGSGEMGSTSAVVVFDIDHFKSINDTFGHAGGDRMLRLFADELRANCRAGDVAARLGGEEFAMVLRDVTPGQTELVAERIRRAFEQRQIVFDGAIATCTVSAGVAPGRPTPVPFDALLRAADKALYAAKRAGRNRVELASHLHAVPMETVRTGS